MKSSFRLIRLMITVLVLASAISAWFFLYNPNRKALQSLLIENAILQASARADTVVALIERCREGAASLSSRTMLKRSMQEYYSGKRTLESTREFHIGLYDDGARVFAWLSGVERYMDGQLVAQYGKPVPWVHLYDHTGTEIEVYFNYIQKDKLIPNKPLPCADSVRFISPVIQDGLVLAYDFLCFDLNEILDSVQSDPWIIEILSIEEARTLCSKTDPSYSLHSDKLFKINGSIGIIEFIPGTESAVVVSTDSADFFSQGFKFLKMTLVRFLAVLVLLLTSSNVFIVFVLHRLLKRLEVSRDHWRETSMRDSLTGLYSRRSLETWLDTEISHQKEALAIVLIDLDEFKEINDILGHDTGDAVLMAFAPLIQSVLRSDDIAIRYGGDEFLLILQNCGEGIARTIMTRLEEALKSISIAERAISISWGIEVLAPPLTRDRFESAIRSADKAMYRMKREHQKKRKK